MGAYSTNMNEITADNINNVSRNASRQGAYNNPLNTTGTTHYVGPAVFNIHHGRRQLTAQISQPHLKLNPNKNRGASIMATSGRTLSQHKNNRSNVLR